MVTGDGQYSVDVDGVRETDVLVVGGGPSGCLAALSARRNGADVTLLERESYLGGSMTGAMVYSLEGYRAATEGSPYVVGGIAREVTDRLLEVEGTDPAGGDGELNPYFPGQYTDPTIATHVLDWLMDEANVDVLFNTFAFDAIVEDDRVGGAFVANKSGGQAILADRVVDCSGDADVAAAAGAPFQQGRPEDGRYHGGALLMHVAGIDLDRLIDYLREPVDMTPAELDELEAEKRRLLGGGGEPDVALTIDGEVRDGYGPHRPRDWDQIEADREAGRPINFSVRAGPSGQGATYEYEGDVPPETKYDRAWIEWIEAGEVPQWLGTPDGVNIYPPAPSLGVLGYGMFKHGERRYDTMLTGMYEAYFDQTDQDAISVGTMYMREVNWSYIRFLRERVPGFENAYIAKEAPSIGTRESRRILGGYVLTAEDAESARTFPDVVARSGRAPSAHGVTGEWGTFVPGDSSGPFDIPYRCLVPKTVEDLLVAGRSISVTHAALGAIRFQVTCMATGEAAGAAAALSARLGVAPRDLDVSLLQQRLLEQGAILFDEDRADEAAAVREAPSLADRLAGGS